MPARVTWYTEKTIILFSVSDPLTLEELEAGAEEVWALAAEVREPVDMIFDYLKVSSFPRGILPVVRDGHFTFPMLDRVALVGNEILLEMMMTTLTRATYRPDPTIHPDIEEAAETLIRMAEEDGNR
jgi:hypothetical protein